MAKASSPWMKFYPQDWRADEKLRMCSLAARGLWMEMLAIMHRSERYGQLLISGRVPTDAQLAVQVGALPDEVSALLLELEDAGVFSRAASGAIYSRRMTRDHKKAENAKKNGKLGGNPSLRKERENTTSDNPSDKGGVKAQKPEARDSVSKDTGANADPVKVIFDLGRTLLMDAGATADAAGSLIGKWRKEYGDRVVLECLMDCQAKRISNPKEWMPRRLQAAGKGQSAQGDLEHLMAQSARYRRAAA